MKKVKFTKEKLIISTIIGVAIIILAIYFMLYLPLIKDVRTKYLEYKSIENDVLYVRNIIKSTGRTYSDRVLMTEKDISHAIDELTKHGKSKKINFISISPGKVRKENGQYKILPIKMNIKSTYKQIGIFLGSLDELKRGLVKIKSFNIVSDKHNPTELDTNLIADMYLSGK